MSRYAPQDRIMGRRRAAALVLTGGIAFCLSLFLIIWSDPTDRPIAGNSSYSISAIGHAAFLALLRDQGYEVSVNRNKEGRAVTERDLLLILEPELGLARAVRRDEEASEEPHSTRPESLERLLQGKAQALIALPKWQADPVAAREAGIWRRRDHVHGVSLAPPGAVRSLAQAVLGDSEVRIVRKSAPDDWTSALGDVDVLLDSPQLITSSNLEPIVASPHGILVGQVPGTRIAVLSDPDLIANHGLRMGGNALMALRLIDHLLPYGGSVHVDETLHGFAVVPSLPRLLFRPPFLAATLLTLAALATLAWIGTTRFGAPLAASRAGLSGNILLMRNAGRLLAASGNDVYIAERYAEAVIDEASRRFHLPQGPSNRSRSRRALERIAQRSGVRRSLPDTASPARLVRDYFRWMEELFNANRTGS